MAGGGVVAVPGAHGNKRPAKRLRAGVRVDMTPLVDVAFLLLTFFMLTTSMTQPQVMEINIPPDPQTQVPTRESDLLSLLVDQHGGIYWAVGMQMPKRVELVNLRSLLRERLAANPRTVALVRIDRKGSYKSIVDILDELNLTNITRLSLLPFRDADRALIAGVSA